MTRIDTWLETPPFRKSTKSFHEEGGRRKRRKSCKAGLAIVAREQAPNVGYQSVHGGSWTMWSGVPVMFTGTVTRAACFAWERS